MKAVVTDFRLPRTPVEEEGLRIRLQLWALGPDGIEEVERLLNRIQDGGPVLVRVELDD